MGASSPRSATGFRTMAFWKLLAIALSVSLLMGGLLYQLVSYYVLYQAEKNVQNLLLSHRGLHQYIQRTMHPAFYAYRDAGEIPLTFYAPEILSSSFMVRVQHTYYNEARKEAGLPEVYYKMAATNPRNPVNIADEREARLIRQFNQEKGRKEYREVIEEGGRKYLFYAVPFLANAPRCMKCHGRREDAPIGLQRRYPGEGGFNEKLGYIRAVESVKVPLDREFFTVHIIWGSLFAGTVAILLLTLFNRSLRDTVLRRTRDLESEVAERQRAEEEVRSLNADLERRVAERTRQLAATNQELDSFAYSVSHDLRAPLRGIDGFSLALLEDYSDKLDDTGRDYLQRVRAGCVRMGGLIDDLLQMSRLTRGELHRETIDLSEMASAVAEELRRQAPERRVETRITPGLKSFADRTLMRAVLDNLIGNAWKFTGKTAHPVIEFGSRREGGQDLFFVRDNGAGFNMEYQGQLFKAFQRLHATLEFEGTGIGLATVQRIIHRHGGRIWAEAAEGQGATFFFTLPHEESYA